MTLCVNPRYTLGGCAAPSSTHTSVALHKIHMDLIFPTKTAPSWFLPNGKHFGLYQGEVEVSHLTFRFGVLCFEMAISHQGTK